MKKFTTLVILAGLLGTQASYGAFFNFKTQKPKPAPAAVEATTTKPIVEEAKQPVVEVVLPNAQEPTCNKPHTTEGTPCCEAEKPVAELKEKAEVVTVEEKTEPATVEEKAETVEVKEEAKEVKEEITEKVPAAEDVSVTESKDVTKTEDATKE